MKTEKYFVCTEGDGEPQAIRFSYDDAMKENCKYIDSFDKNGEYVKSYKKIDDNKYTTDF